MVRALARAEQGFDWARLDGFAQRNTAKPAGIKIKRKKLLEIGGAD
jgi:hypothetical protein